VVLVTVTLTTRDLDDFVEAGALQHVEAGHLLLGLRERPVGDDELTIPDLDRGRVRRRPRAAPMQADPGRRTGSPEMDTARLYSSIPGAA
jgi:hypothetical protein